MAASNLFKNNDETMSNFSGICNAGAMNDSSNSSVYAHPDSSNSSADQNNELIDLNETNHLEMSLNQKNNQLNQLSGHYNYLNGNQINRNLSNNNQFNQLNNPLPDNQAIDITLQNYLFDYKSFADDTKSLSSVMTSKSTRETFDFLSRILPIGILLLIIFIMIHFVLYVRDIEPFQSITEVICIGLACAVFSLSSAFIVKQFCDSKDRAQWTNTPYSEEYIYTPNNYLYNGHHHNEQQNQAVIGNHNQPTHLINPKNYHLINQTGNGDFNNAQDVIRKQPHYYIDTGGNRIYCTQLAGLEYKNKRFANDLSPPINQTVNLNNQQRIQNDQTNSFNHRTNLMDPKTSFDQRTSNIDKKVEQSIQTINLIEAKRKESLIKETAT